jgi:hypothetical protein
MVMMYWDEAWDLELVKPWCAGDSCEFAGGVMKLLVDL